MLPPAPLVPLSAPHIMCPRVTMEHASALMALATGVTCAMYEPLEKSSVITIQVSVTAA